MHFPSRSPAFPFTLSRSRIAATAARVLAMALLVAPRVGTASPAAAGPTPAHAAGHASGHAAGHTPHTDHQLVVESIQARGADSTLAFTLRNAEGTPVTELLEVHTRPLHLLITTPELDALQHVHPVPAAHGRWTVKADLSRPVEYLLFAEFTPRGGRPQVARATVNRRATPTTATAPSPLPEAVQPAVRMFGAYQVGMYVTPGANADERTVTFHVSRQGRPVTFSPYLGERGHAVLFTRGATRLVHAHPTGDQRPGHVSFRVPVTPGERMRVWGQFKVAEDAVLADFVMDPSVQWDG